MKISVGILIQDKKICLVKRNHPEGRLLWHFPAGKIKDGEESADAIQRELLEETTLHSRVAWGESTSGYVSTCGILVMGCEVVGGILQVGDEDEIAEVRWVGYDECMELITTDLFGAVDMYLREKI